LTQATKHDKIEHILFLKELKKTKDNRMRVFDERGKITTKWNRNYFFVATLLILIAQLVLFLVFHDSMKIETAYDNQTTLLSFQNLYKAYLNCFLHINWQHLLISMICFLVCGLYLERKMGSINFFLFVLFMTFFTSAVTAANSLQNAEIGFMVVNYGLFGYSIVEFFFLFQKGKCKFINIFLGIVMIAFIYFATCFTGGTQTISFEKYPVDLIYNMGHYSGFLTGILLGLVIEFSKFAGKRKVALQGTL
jgi:membrane associated rhomboid family serine protease